MKWLEIIELRSVNCNRELLELQLQNFIHEIEKKSDQNVIKVYNHVALEGDFNIHLCHDSDKIQNCGSPLGLHLASSLKEFGLVNHSIWIEMHNKSLQKDCKR